MPTTFANTIDGNEILAKRSQCDYAGNDIQTTYATKSELPTATSDLTNDSGFITLSDVPAQVNADWNASSGVSEILNKPDLSIYAESSDLATVATSGSYNDLLDKPSIPSAQVNADWDATSGVSEILNKPNLATVATTGDYSDLQNLPSIPAAQVNSDWSATSGVAQILNKPSIPTATSDLTNDSGYITLSDVPAQVNSDWNATSGVSEILNKPTIPSGSQLVPAATSADANKVLTVNAQGTPAWANAGGGNAVYVTWDDTSAGWSSMWTQVQAALSANKDVYIKDDFCVAEVTGVYDGQVNFRGLAGSSGVPPIITYNYYYLQQGFASKYVQNQYVLPSPGGGDVGQVLGLVSSDDPPYKEPAWVNSSGGGGSQVNSDWDATSGVAEILNKPDLSVYATTSAMTSALADKQDTLTAGTNVSISNNVISATDTTYSAGTGIDITNNEISVETPVDIVAGPGIVVDNPDGNTLRVSVAQAEEVVLWEGTYTSDNAGIAFSESYKNFEFIRVEYTNNDGMNETKLIKTDQTATMINLPSFYVGSAQTQVALKDAQYTIGNTSLVYLRGVDMNIGASTTVTAVCHITVNKVVGIHRTASN